MKRKPLLSEASVEEILRSFTELGIVRKVALPSPIAETTDNAPEGNNALRPHRANVRTRVQRYA
jgi:hypothetical protein